MTGLVWFRRDLRLDDNPAWAAATTGHETVAALYVLDPRLLAAAGPHRRARLEAEVAALDVALAERGGRLLVRTGDPVTVVPAEAARLGAAHTYWNADVSPYATRRDQQVAQALPDGGVTTTWGTLVLPPGSVRTGEGRVHRVFGAFHRAWRATAWDPWPEPGAATVLEDPGDGPPAVPGDAGLEAGLEGDGTGVGTAAAVDQLHRFLADGVDRYPASRDDVGLGARGGGGTSALSVALRFGTLSPRHVVSTTGDATAGREAFVRQLAWRDWFAHLLHESPELVHHAQRRELDAIRWLDDPEDLAAWQDGRTGFPLVDAGMRELRATGAMHNRVRMVAASFLVKDLLVDWRHGERHFRRLLTDADPAQNVGNWQWVAGTGPDAAPYFRVFNPVTQSRTHDAGGHYLRRWVPELAGLDDRAIHAPWEAPPLELAAAGVTLGETYPFPIVDHALARHRALAAYAEARA
jgi:deoxyribodipyrimidine photo-lyase